MRLFIWFFIFCPIMVFGQKWQSYTNTQKVNVAKQVSAQIYANIEQHIPEYRRPFIQRFGWLAVYDYNEYGVLASVKIAQGGLECGWGLIVDRGLQGNNYFSIKCREKAPSGLVLVDGFSVGDVQEVVIRDRQMLAQDGIFIVFGIINNTTGRLRKSPDIISRGFVYLRESQDLLHEVRLIVKDTVDRSSKGMRPLNIDYVKENITDAVSQYLLNKTAKRPMVIPVILTI
jgi:hypothetical protein